MFYSILKFSCKLPVKKLRFSNRTNYILSRLFLCNHSLSEVDLSECNNLKNIGELSFLGVLY